MKLMTVRQLVRLPGIAAFLDLCAEILNFENWHLSPRFLSVIPVLPNQAIPLPEKISSARAAL
jgi:hypothetical protein